MTIHWCGTGLSAIPGLRKLIEDDQDVMVWNRTVPKAQEAVGDLTDRIAAFTVDALTAELNAGDVIVSMLPADMHVPLAELALSKGAHFVSSSYISPEMQALDGKAKKLGLSLVNEVGLDPGIDHLFAHDLVAAYRASGVLTSDTALSFTSYCGGVPKVANDFRYKFSWSPLGVLRVLKSPSKSIKAFEEWNVDRPWNALSRYEAPLPEAEEFEVYPNRDSLPFIAAYNFDPAWTIKDFVRGTLRLDGWADAWKPLFDEIETLSGPEGEARLREMSEQLWNDHAYDDGEPDRVVMCVSLEAKEGDSTTWHQTYVMDAWGDERGSAMARLVSMPVAMAVRDVLAGRFAAGVHAAPEASEQVSDWIEAVSGLAQHLEKVDHLG